MKKVFKVHIEEVAPSWASNFAGFMDKSTKKKNRSRRQAVLLY
ncbi:MAG TPA: hypothetical protein PLN63_06770 [Paludibacteraceae bacterium]|nr:hypothetical protein [Paludibacteraceae bacterium]HPH63303.1 hypothetical protein [Paludibacteraceae bacterium]